jgi:DNA-binding NarL/FixJ family response regulator
MIGREAEWTLIERVLERAVRGPGGIALEGAAGIGKTTVWREAVRAAEERGYLVLRTAPAEPDAQLSFAALGDLLEAAVGEVASDLPDPQRRALSAALLLEESSEPTAPETLPRAVLTVIRRLAAQGPLMLAIDDEQWLDRPSARVLAFALCRLRNEPIGVLLARRPAGESYLWSELARGFGEAGLPALVLEPLGLDAVQRLVEARLGRPVGRSMLTRVYDTSGGNPLYALAIAAELGSRANGDPGGLAPAIPRSLADAVGSRLEQLDHRAGDPLLVVAAVSRPTVALLQAVLSDFTLGDLDGAERAGVIEMTGDRVAFTHPLLAAAHYAGARPARRREIHRLLAKVLEDEEECAYHLACGAEAPDDEIAGRIERAAQTAARRGAPDTGGELLEYAARLTPAHNPDARRARIVSAARLQLAGGDAGRARELLEALMPELPPGPGRARAVLLSALTRSDDHAAAQALLEQALEEVGDDHRLCAEIQAHLAQHAFNGADFGAMMRHANAALESAELAGDPGLLAVAIAGHASSAFFCGREVNLERLEGAIDFECLAHSRIHGLPSEALAQILFWSDDYVAARPAHERVIRLVRERGHLYTTGYFVLELAVLEWWAGNRELARRHLADSQQLVRGQGDHSLDLMLTWIETLFAAERGELEQANAHGLQALDAAEESGDPIISCAVSEVLAAVELWTGQPGSAHDRLQSVRDAWYSAGFSFLGALTLPLWSIDIEALIACNQLDEAQALLDELLERARKSENPNALAIAERCRGLVLGAHGQIAEAIEAMEGALVAHDQRPLAPEIARTLLELGALQRRAKQKNAAKHTLERALEMFVAIGAPMWEERTRDQLARIGLRRPVVTEGLTPAQQRVADLVVAGKSNREIASALYMSTRSVEAHLTKIYRALGVRSRAQLVATLSTDTHHAAATTEGSDQEFVASRGEGS